MTGVRERGIDKVRTNKISFFFFFLQYYYNAILPLELHCSNIANFFAILGFYKFECGGFLDLYAKFCLHIAYGIWHSQCESSQEQ